MIRKHNTTVIILAAIMDLFYIRHHYQSIVRSTSFGGEIFAFFIIAIFFGGSTGSVYQLLDGYSDQLNVLLGLKEDSYLPFLMAYLLMDLALKLIFKRPLPKIHYYLLWIDKSKQISKQYLFTTLFGIVPFLFFISLVLVSFNAHAWLGWLYALVVLTWWLTNHFLGLMTQFSHPRARSIGLIAIFSIGFLMYWSPLDVASFFLQPSFSLIMLLASISGSYILVRRTLEQREFVEIKERKSVLKLLPSLNFKNPVLQLEWALIARNKRTRSNLLMGLLSVLIFPLIIDSDTKSEIALLIYFFTTGFFIVQHGIYSFGWEGSYFDFLQVNIQPKTFVKTRYLFYAGACTIGLFISIIPVLLNDLDIIFLAMIFLYNVGVTIPLVLYRSTLNDTKINLSENSFMNYNGMMTGPIFVSSFLVTLLPIFIYSLSDSFYEGFGVYILGGLGLLGLLLHNQIVLKISRVLKKRKYHLSQSFKS